MILVQSLQDASSKSNDSLARTKTTWCLNETSKEDKMRNVITCVGVSTTSLNEAVANAHILLEEHCSKAQIVQIATAVNVAVTDIGSMQYTFTMTVVVDRTQPSDAE